MLKSLSTPYGKTKILHTQPQAPTGETVAVIPGFSESIRHNKPLVQSLTARGFEVITFDQPRRTGAGDYRIKSPIERLGSVADSILKAAGVTEPVHALAHSLGTGAALKAAKKNPALFKSLTLMEPIAMAGEQSFTEEANRVSKKVFKNELKAARGQTTEQPEGRYAARVDTESRRSYFGRVTGAQLVGGKNLAVQPIMAINEAIAAGSAQAVEDFKSDIDDVIELGIPVHLVTAHGDELYDFNKIDAAYAAGILATSHSEIADIEASHDAFWMHPEQTATLYDQIIHQ